MSIGHKLPADVVWPEAMKLSKLLADSCERFEFAGSLRRSAGDVDARISDLEIVAIPKPVKLRFGVAAERQVNALESMLLDLIQAGAIRRNPPDLARYAWGDRYKKFWIDVAGGWFQVDLFLADARNWGAIYTIRTGPWEFSRALVTHIRYKTPYVQDGGYLRVQATGEIVPVASERDYFAASGVQWIEPAQRRGPDDVYPIRRSNMPGEAPRDQGASSDTSNQLSLF